MSEAEINAIFKSVDVSDDDEEEECVVGSSTTAPAAAGAVDATAVSKRSVVVGRVTDVSLHEPQGLVVAVDKAAGGDTAADVEEDHEHHHHHHKASIFSPSPYRFALFTMFLLNNVNYIDRYVPSAAKDLIKDDLGLSDGDTSVRTDTQTSKPKKQTKKKKNHPQACLLSLSAF